MNYFHRTWFYIRQFKFRSLFVNTLILVLIVGMVPFLFTAIVLYRNFEVALFEEIGAASEAHVVSGRTIYDILLSDVDRVAYALVVNDAVRRFMLDDPGIIDWERRLLLEEVIADLVTVQEPYVDSIYAYSLEHGYIIASDAARGPIDDFYDDVITDSLVAELRDQPRLIVVREKPVSADSRRTVAVTSFVYSTALAQGNYFGVIVVNIDNDRFLRMGLDLDHGGNRQIYVTQPDSTVLFSSDISALGGPMVSADATSWRAPPGEGAATWTIVEDRVYSSARSAHNDWTYTIVSPLDAYRTATNQILSASTIIAAVDLVIILLLAFLISVRIYNPISELIRIMENDDESHGLWLEKGAHANEIHYLARGISESLHEKREIQQELLDRMATLKRAQVEALQAQIEPHFLRNTLNTIHWAAIGMSGGDNEVSHMVTILNEMLGLSIDRSDNLIPATSELDHAARYLDLQRYRYGKMLSVSWDIPRTFRRFRCLKLSLQPLLENAIYHGVKPSRRPATITITGTVSASRISIAVSDDGVGMSEAKVAEVRSRLRDGTTQRGTQVGLSNVHHRLRLLFGSSGGVDVESVPDKGTVVTLALPKIRM